MSDEEQTITDCIANIRHVSEKFDCDVMIVETGFYVDENDPERLERGRPTVIMDAFSDWSE